MARSNEQRTIDVPQLLSRQQRARDTALTGVMWVIYAYLWLPAVSLGAWFLGIDFAYEVMVRAGGAAGLRGILGWYGLALLVMIVGVTVWSGVERIRFRGRERRHAIPRVSDEAVQQGFGVEPAQARLLRQGNCLRLSIDPDGRLRNVRSGAEPHRTA